MGGQDLLPSEAFPSSPFSQLFFRSHRKTMKIETAFALEIPYLAFKQPLKVRSYPSCECRSTDGGGEDRYHAF
jgi:hypothetical protein